MPERWRPKGRALPVRRAAVVLAGVAICVVAICVAAAALLTRQARRPAPSERSFDEAIEPAGSVRLALPPGLPAERVVFARGLREGRWVVAGSGTIAICTEFEGRALFAPSPADPAGLPAIGDDGTIYAPFPGRIESFDSVGTHRSGRAWKGFAHALAVHGGTFAAASLGDDGRLLHVEGPARDLFRLGVGGEIASRFRPSLDVDGEGTLWAVHPARYALFGLTAEGREVLIEGASKAYRAPVPYRGPAAPRAIRAWSAKAWILETVVGTERGAAVAIRALGHRRIEVHDGDVAIAFSCKGRRLIGRDEKRRLAFVREEARGGAIDIELARVRDPLRALGEGGPSLLVFVSSHDCPACLPVLADIESLAREHRTEGLEARAVIGDRDPGARDIVRIEAPSLQVVQDAGDGARRRFGIAAGPAVRLLDREGRVVLALDAEEPQEAARRLREAAAALRAIQDAGPAP